MNRDPVCQNPKADAFKNPSWNPLLNATPAGTAAALVLIAPMVWLSFPSNWSPHTRVASAPRLRDYERPATVAAKAEPVEAASAPLASASAQAWGEIKGRVVFVGDEIPDPTLFVRKGALNVKDAAVSAAQDIFSEELVVNRENRGIRWAVVYLNKPPAVHPDLAMTEGEVEVNIKACTFRPHVLAMREGQILRITNSDPIAHCKNLQGLKNSPDAHILDAAPEGGKSEYRLADLKAERIRIVDNIHPWMSAWVAIFNHPYFAVTDDDGAFEIRHVPVGKVTLVVWQENIGFGEGKAAGKEIEIKPDETTDLGELKIELPKTAK